MKDSDLGSVICIDGLKIFPGVIVERNLKKKSIDNVKSSEKNLISTFIQ